MINISAFCFGNLGVQKHGYNFIKALGKYDNIALFPWDRVPPVYRIPPFLKYCLRNARKETIEHNIGIGIGVMNRMPLIIGSKKIAFTVWETSKIPIPELEHLKHADEIWIPSTWGKTLLEQNGIHPDRVNVVPEGVDTQLYKPRPLKGRAASNDRFRFLCVGKWEKRKGIDVLLKAYGKAFKVEDPVELVLHCFNPQTPRLDIRAAIAKIALPPHPHIRYSSPVNEMDMVDLYNSCDAFVLPSRAEGWGLPVIEAMACAKPVIVTNHSAYLDFVNSSNGYLVDVKTMVKVKDPGCFGSDLDYGEWAEPDEEHLQWVLRYVFEHQQEASAIGRIAREDIAKSWTWDHAAARAQQYLKRH